jgi:hypothetical protein
MCLLRAAGDRPDNPTLILGRICSGKQGQRMRHVCLPYFWCAEHVRQLGGESRREAGSESVEQTYEPMYENRI